ncbi:MULTISPECIES: cytochrome c6 PetJ [Planktothrix]|uniref:cytochrome c6 PetJ n=1 Tax=Planktothrix TaxID=54304 RepID=UPI0004013E8F|nr:MULTISPECIES: c-type cytochrome [Planktothrix]CAD0229360.1 Cytochrome c6 [Planktothrix agardhii]CAD5934837.1 Cytochrome c6 [Planktothrix agardhii]
MKKIISVLLVMTVAILTFVPNAFAANLENGAKVFSANCASCHAGGKNLVNGAKTLKKADLEKYGMYDVEKIKTQVTNGKGAMPGFKGRLKDDQIADVAAYVLAQADQDWKK